MEWNLNVIVPVILDATNIAATLSSTLLLTLLSSSSFYYYQNMLFTI